MRRKDDSYNFELIVYPSFEKNLEKQETKMKKI